MEQNYKTHYKRKFYTRKIVGIFVHAWLIALSAFLFAGFATSDIYEQVGEDFFFFNTFGILAAVYLGALAWINGVRIARLRDDVIGNRYPENKTREDFWSGLFTKSLWAIIILEVILFILLYVLINSGAPWSLYLALVVCMGGTLLIKLRYNANVKEIRTKADELVKTGKEYAIHAKKEKKFVVWFTLLWCFFLFCLIIYFLTSDAYQANIDDPEILFPLLAIVVGLVMLIPQIQSINAARDDEELQEWISKQEAEQKAAEEKKAAEAKAKAEASETKTEENDVFKDLDGEFQDVNQPQYMHVNSLRALCADFSEFVQAEGVSIESAAVTEIFAAMFASRAVWLRSDDLAYAARVACAIKKYFQGESGAVTVKMSAFNNQSLFYNDSDEEDFIPLLKQLYRAQKLTNSVNVVVFKNAEQADFNQIFAEFINAFRAPEDENKVHVNNTAGYRWSDNASVPIPSNLWCIFVGGAKNKSNAVNREYASEVYLRKVGESYKPAFPPVRNSFLSFARFGELLSESMQKHFLSLDMWKKLDRLEEYLQGQIPFAITNPLARQIEQYSSVLLACEVSEQEVVDKVLETRIVPLLGRYKKEQINAEGNTLPEMLDSLFGMDNLPRTQKALTDRNLF